MIISSKDNEIVKEIRKLKEKKYRKDKFIVEGIKMLEIGRAHVWTPVTG